MVKEFFNSIAICASEIGYWRYQPAKAVLNAVKLISCLAATVFILGMAVVITLESSKAPELSAGVWLFFAITPFFTWLLIARVDTFPKLFRFYVCLYSTDILAVTFLVVLRDPSYQNLIGLLYFIGIFVAAWWLPLTRRNPHYIEIWKHHSEP